jgi:hypothetical protein
MHTDTIRLLKWIKNTEFHFVRRLGFQGDNAAPTIPVSELVLYRPLLKKFKRDEGPNHVGNGNFRHPRKSSVLSILMTDFTDRSL